MKNRFDWTNISHSLKGHKYVIVVMNYI